MLKRHIFRALSSGVNLTARSRTVHVRIGRGYPHNPAAIRYARDLLDVAYHGFLPTCSAHQRGLPSFRSITAGHSRIYGPRRTFPFEHSRFEAQLPPSPMYLESSVAQW